MVEEGKKKTDIKKALKWPTTRKKLAEQEAREVEQAIDQMLERHRASPDRQLAGKDMARRERHLKKIRQLREEGKTVGQIRSRMHVYSGNAAWPASEQQWFEEVIKGD